MPTRPCLVCGRLGHGSYCQRHRPRSGSRAWRGGSTRSWRELRTQALMRDGYRCVSCGSGERLEVHHRLPRAKGGKDSLANVETRCESCHRAAHGGRRE